MIISQGVGSLLMAKAKSLNLPIRLRTFQENLGARRFMNDMDLK